jgi:hypothetical protein
MRQSRLGVGRFVVLDVRLGGFGGVMRSVLMMAVREMRVMRGQFVLAVLVVLGGGFMMARRMFMMLGRCVMMLCCYFGHNSSMRLR